MSLSSKTELARALFRSTPPDSVTRISGTATADSSDGTVTVQLEDGDVIEVGTIGSVSAGDTVTIHVQRGEAQVIASEGWGDAMQAAVDEAQAIAEATGQHFWHDTNGAHVTEVTQEQWQQSQTGSNALWNSQGMLLRDALTYLAAFAPGSVAFYDGQGNATANATAKFGTSGVQVGKEDESHLELDYHSLRLIDKDGNEYLDVNDQRDQSGIASVSDTFESNGGTGLFYLTYTAVDTSYTVTVDGVAVTPVQRETSFFILSPIPAAGAVVVVEYGTEEAVRSFTFGTRGAGAVGSGSFSEGYENVASGHMSHAEGRESAASGGVSHAEGSHTIASGDESHAEGSHTIASGFCSHAQNQGTIAQDYYQTALGRYNVADSTNALIIGNGTADNARSNALTVDWSGNVEAAGDVSGATLSSAGGLSLYGGTALEDCFSAVTVSGTIGSIAAGGSKWVTVDATRTGYKPLAVVGYYLNGANMLVPYCARLSGTDAQFALRNSGSSASSSSATLDVQVLYIKTSA